MKNKFKLAGLLLFAMASVGLFSCSKDTPTTPSPTENSLSGSTWTAPYGNDKLYVIKFTSNSRCESYFADRNLNYVGSAKQGSYSISSNTVTFSGIEFVDIYMHYVLNRGNITGNFMNTSGENYVMTSSGSGTHYNWSQTWNKR